MPEIAKIGKADVPLADLTAGEEGIIRGYQGQNDAHARLRELGLVRGTKVLVKRFAPFGDPMEVVVRGYHLSLRKKDAAQILVSRVIIHGCG